MNISDNGLALIKKFEGFMSHRYLCPAGKLTIGYGHVLQSGEEIDEPLSEQDASDLLRNDVDTRYSPAVSGMLAGSVTQNQFDALCSFAYNLGAHALQTSTLLLNLNGGNVQAAAEEFLRWDHINGVVSDGLLRRRVTERAIFITP